MKDCKVYKGCQLKFKKSRSCTLLPSTVLLYMHCKQCAASSAPDNAIAQLQDGGLTGLYLRRQVGSMHPLKGSLGAIGCPLTLDICLWSQQHACTPQEWGVMPHCWETPWQLAETSVSLQPVSPAQKGF